MSRRRLITALFGAGASALAAVTYFASAPHSTTHALPIRATAAAPPTSPAPPPSGVVVFGDSLVHEAAPFLAVKLADVDDVTMQTYPLTAPCDWATAIAHAIDHPPRVAVFEFSGNALTPCMQNADGSPLSPNVGAARYRRDAASITQRFTAVGTTVLWVDAPRGRQDSTRTDQFSADEPFTTAIYRAIVRRFDTKHSDVRFVPASRAVLAGRGAWTADLPCLASDTAAGACIDGVVPVRAPDGAHFCPSGITGADGSCSVWSSGAWRYATAIAREIRAATPKGTP